MRKCSSTIFICSVHFPTVQKHTGFETIPHLYWKNDKGVKPANGFQTAFSGHSVLSMKMSRLTRDGTAEPISETKFSGTHGDRGILIFPVQLTTSTIGNLTRLIHTLLYVMTIHTYIHTVQYCSPSPQTSEPSPDVYYVLSWRTTRGESTQSKASSNHHRLVRVLKRPDSSVFRTRGRGRKTNHR